ncbi:MAG: DUF2281 domain-containing protein [Prevotellaceae bacterium]|jgi:hypothetical protein|nr:DUF2281 domain-containing protein [Prevotellaceae bacterium]
METSVLYRKILQLPLPMQQEVSDYVETLLRKGYERSSRRPRAGCMKGTFAYMSEDFNAPLDDFKDYV